MGCDVVRGVRRQVAGWVGIFAQGGVGVGGEVFTDGSFFGWCTCVASQASIDEQSGR